MNIAMGGNWGSDAQYETGGLKNGIDPSLTSVKMEIDYVRLYESLAHPYSINDPSAGEIILFPNPTSGIIGIKLPVGNTARGTVSDVDGKEVFQFQAKSDTTKIDLSSLSKGLYNISILTEGKIITRKIILQ
jgi:hypothetical protein